MDKVRNRPSGPTLYVMTFTARQTSRLFDRAVTSALVHPAALTEQACDAGDSVNLEHRTNMVYHGENRAEISLSAGLMRTRNIVIFQQ